jgi:cysteine-rich repeat protein
MLAFPACIFSCGEKSSQADRDLDGGPPPGESRDAARASGGQGHGGSWQGAGAHAGSGAGGTLTELPDGSTGTSDASPRDAMAPDEIGDGGMCPFPAVVEGSTTGTTIGGSVLLEPSCASISGSGPQRVYSFTSEVTGRLTASLSTDVDLGLSVWEGCSLDGPELGCVDLVPTYPESIGIPVLVGDEHLIAVHGFASGDSGGFSLGVVVTPAECGNGLLDGGEACDDGNDVPGDGCTDCRLDACVSPPTFSSSVDGDTTDLPSVVHTSCANPSSGPEAIHAYVASVPGSHVATVTPLGEVDFVLAARSVCDDAAGERCVDDGFTGEAESIVLDLDAGEIVYLIVQGWSSFDAGPYSLEVQAP